MRSRVTAAVVFLVIFGSLTASATSNQNYKDKFDSIGWGGSSGSLPWSGPWVEIGDDGDEKKGAVRVVSSGNCASGNCLSIDASLLPNVGARRTADTSILGYAELCYDLNIIPGLDLGGTLHVQVRPGSGGWITLQQYSLGDETEIHPEIDISDYAAEALQLRFLVTGLLSTSQVYVDNVEISGELLEEPTTTTTTVPATTTTTTIDDDTTTTTRPRPTTTTTHSTTTTSEEPDESDGSTTTTTTVPDTSTTTTAPSEDGTPPTLVVAIGGGDEPPSPGGPSTQAAGTGGIRQAGRGLQASFDPALFGQVGVVSPITGVDLEARFSLAAEVIESTWVWMVLLATVIAWSIVSGMDRRRSQPGH